MKSIFFTIVLSGIVMLSVAQDITGSWQGSLSNVRFIMNVTKKDGALRSSFDSPDQKVFGIAGGKTTLANDSILADITPLNAVYAGKWNGKDEITGVFKQGGMSINLNLKRLTDAEKAAPTPIRIRPQTPKPPFPYDSEEVEYDNADKSVHFGATYTRPKTGTNIPTVIIISGSGSQDRDGTLFGHKLYAVLADYLTRQGIAVLRVDDRGVGKSSIGNNPSAITSDVFSRDVEASLNYLLSRPDVDKKRIGLIGHSEGGIIAPMVAARRRDVDFIVLWGAPTIGGLQINTQQNAYALRKAGFDSASVNAFIQLHESILSQFASANTGDIDTRIQTTFAEWKAKQSNSTLSALHVTGTGIVGQDIKMYRSLFDMAWMNFFITYDPTRDLAKVSCPVLAINGSKDSQVDAVTNLALINSVLTRSGNKHFSTMSLPSLNHLLQTAVTGDDAEYETIEETMSPSALLIIANWIKGVK
jgi:pimeloyl-ACP methyl ester carboxylesterase